MTAAAPAAIPKRACVPGRHPPGEAEGDPRHHAVARPHLADDPDRRRPHVGDGVPADERGPADPREMTRSSQPPPATNFRPPPRSPPHPLRSSSPPAPGTPEGWGLIRYNPLLEGPSSGVRRRGSTITFAPASPPGPGDLGIESSVGAPGGRLPLATRKPESGAEEATSSQGELHLILLQHRPRIPKPVLLARRLLQDGEALPGHPRQGEPPAEEPLPRQELLEEVAGEPPGGV